MVLIEGLHRLMLHALAQVIQSPKHTDDSVWPGASPLILPISAQACLFNIHICLNIFHILCILLQSSERPVKCNSQVLDWAIIVDTDLNQKGDVAKVAYPKFHCSFCCPISGGENWHPFDPLGFFDCQHCLPPAFPLCKPHIMIILFFGVFLITHCTSIFCCLVDISAS